MLLNSYDYITLIKSNDEPFFAWFGGGRKIGKSHVILALFTLILNWQQPNFVMVITQMGIATMSAEGHTIHATFKFNLNGKPHGQQFIVRNIEAFVGLHLLIIEKASTCSKSFLGSTDVCLR